jgi:DNA-binding transcriptional MerR regulator
MLISTSHAARVIGISAATVRLWADRGLLPAQRLADGTRVFELDVVERIAAEKRHPEPRQ